VTAILKGPYLQWPTTSSVTVMWETAAEARGAVEWFDTQAVHAGLSGRAQTLTSTKRCVTEEGSGRVHRVDITGLLPDTEYHYRVVGESGEPHSVFAAPPADRPYCFCVTSETGGYGDDDINRRLFAEMARWRPDMLVVVGDAVRDGRQYDDWERYFFGPGRELLHSTPFYLCPGNHEENADWFYRFTAFPTPGNYYGFDFGNTHFTALDSTRLVDYVDGVPRATAELDTAAAQPSFLRQDLARAQQARWRVVFFHYPPYVSGDYEVEPMRRLVPDLEAGGVDLVFNSHTIVYERSHPLRGGRFHEDGGIVYVVAGGAGAKADWFHPKRAGHTAQALAVPHFVHVTVAGSTLEAKAVDIDGRVFDSWILRK
jgi:acid phosphatase type 7